MIKKLLWLNVALAPFVLADNPTLIPAVSVLGRIPASQAYEDETITIDRKKIHANANTSLGEVLKSQSVVRVANNSGNSYQSILSIRGFGDNAEANSLILVDGFPLINSSLLAPNFNAILLSDIQKIDLFQGSQGSLWGSQAVGGVVDVQTLQPQKPVADLNLSYGSYNSTHLSALFGDKLDNGLFYKISGFDSHSDNYRQHNQQSDGGASLTEGYNYATGALILTQKIDEASVQFPGSLTQAQYDADPQQATDTQDYVHYKTQSYQLTHKQILDPNWCLETRLATSSTHSYGWFRAPYDGNESLNWFSPELIGNFSGKKFTFGYVAQSSHYREMLTPPSTSSAANSSQNDVYAQSFIPLWQKWDITLGARAAWQSNNPQIVLGEPIHYLNRVFVTEQGVNYHINEAWSWFARRDGNFRFPKTNEEVWLANDATELQPQTGVSYETGFGWQTLRQKAHLSFYELLLHNEIAYDPTQTENQPFGATSNFDATTRKGISFTHEIAWNDKLGSDTQFQYVDARFVSGPYSGNVVPAVPTYNAGAGIHYQWTPQWRTTYYESYSGSAYASNDVANVAPKAAAYWLGQCALQYQLKNTQVSLQVNNIFDQRYAVYTVSSQSTSTDSYYPGAGRNVVLSLKTQWT